MQLKKEKLRVYGVRLRQDQIEFLKGLDDAAKVVRQLIDNYILESGKPDVILINKKITILNRRITEIMDSPLYKACMFNIEARERVKDYEAENETEYTGNIRLRNLVVFRTENIEVNSETWKKTIDESVDLINSFRLELRKYAKQIHDLQDKLKALHK